MVWYTIALIVSKGPYDSGSKQRADHHRGVGLVREGKREKTPEEFNHSAIGLYVRLIIAKSAPFSNKQRRRERRNGLDSQRQRLAIYERIARTD